LLLTGGSARGKDEADGPGITNQELPARESATIGVHSAHPSLGAIVPADKRVR
jgi:hypothetical protein